MLSNIEHLEKNNREVRRQARVLCRSGLERSGSFCNEFLKRRSWDEAPVASFPFLPFESLVYPFLGRTLRLSGHLRNLANQELFRPVQRPHVMSR